MMQDKSLVSYRFATDADSRCATCRYFVPESACALVAGDIRPDAVCDVYAKGEMWSPPEDAVAYSVKGDYSVLKSDDAQQNIFGWSYVSVTKDGEEVVDFSGEILDIDTLEAATYDFVIRSRASGEDHTPDISGVLIESVVMTDEKFEAWSMGGNGQVDQEALDALRKHLPLGAWMGFHIPDRDAYERAIAEKSDFSIEGVARRVPVDA